MKTVMKKWLPLILTAVMTIWFLGTMRSPKDPDFAYTTFGKLPILSDGRLKPLDSLARYSLLEIREKQTLNTEPWKDWHEHPKMISAIQWLTTVMMNSEQSDKWPVFRVDNPELTALLKLPAKDKAQNQDGKHYSWNQIQPALAAFDQESSRIIKIEAGRLVA